MIDDLEQDLARLPEPAAPDSITATVMARVSRLSERPASVAPPAIVAASTTEFPAWAIAFVGLAVVAVSWLAGGFETDWWRELIASPPDAAQGAATLSVNWTAAFGVALGLVLYVAGLLAPLGRRRLTLPR